jgi:hypothetical protein
VPLHIATLALASFRRGDLADALAIQKDLIRLLDGRDSDRVTLADAEAQLARFEAARAAKGEERR